MRVKLIGFLLLLLMPLALSSCSLPFYWQAVSGQMELLRKRTPIGKVLADENADPELKAELRGIEEILDFAEDELGLPRNGSYTTYADLERPYVVWNVVAAEEFSVDPMRWCFPFTGCVSYRGFFDRSNAEDFQRSLDEEGLDTYSSGSSAYSTLGYFRDPVLNTMLEGGSEYIAPLLFHELAHQKIYVKDDSELSEAFASTIEEYGTERWLTSRDRAAELDAYRERLHRRSQFAELIERQQSRLRAIYEQQIPDADKREAKTAAFDTLRGEYATVRAAWTSGPSYDAWFEQPLNNATLASVATYRRWQPVLRTRLEEIGLDRFYEEIAALAKLDPGAREVRLAELGRHAVTAESGSR